MEDILRRRRENEVAAVPANNAADAGNIVPADIFELARQGGDEFPPAEVNPDNVIVANFEVIDLVIDDDADDAGEVADECPVCLDTIKDNLDLSSCMHSFCLKCIKLWIDSGHTRCPYCRTIIPLYQRRDIINDPRNVTNDTIEPQ